ncbi:MAG: LacI family DNA-binding transcriptional regulator, partial [Burkholderiales bacterium]|nr:LacI family DNA-binding transcriptional regulator [Burkholderiales bacterium]
MKKIAAKARHNPLAVTSVDVARAAGVSQSVVSRAFSLHPSVADATRERIFAVAGRLGYRRNLLAQGLIKRQSNLLALVAGALTSPLHLQFIESLTRIAQQGSYRVLLLANPPGKSLDESLDSVLHYRPAGILAMAGTPSPKMVRTCQRSGVPVVLLGRQS